MCQQGAGLHSVASGVYVGKYSGMKNEENSFTARTGRCRGAEINMFSIRAFFLNPPTGPCHAYQFDSPQRKYIMEKLDE